MCTSSAQSEGGQLLQLCCSSVAALFSVAHTLAVKAARGASVSSSMKEMALEIRVTIISSDAE